MNIDKKYRVPSGATGWQPAPYQEAVPPMLPTSGSNIQRPQSGRMIEYTDEERELLKSHKVTTKMAAKYLGEDWNSQKLLWFMENDPRLCKIGVVKKSAAGTRHATIFPLKLIAYKHGLDIPDDFLDDEEEITDRLERIETAVNQILELMEVR